MKALKSNKSTNEVKTVNELTKVELNVNNEFKELTPLEIMSLTTEERNTYLAKLQANIDAVIEENKKYGRGTYQRHLNKFDSVLLDIYNAGVEGITTSKLIKNGKTFTDAKGKISPINVKTIVKDFGTANNVSKQRGVELLNNPQSFDENSKRPVVNCEIMSLTKDAHPNSEMAKHKYRNENTLFLISGHENVKEYLLQRGATEEMFK